ncbi:hypothetical protein BKI52_32580 [marine bacterium AO1-C]|nr:hypothetical protein BKI52_32580 [marine bacterium AO1-C]
MRKLLLLFICVGCFNTLYAQSGMVLAEGDPVNQFRRKIMGDYYRRQISEHDLKKAQRKNIPTNFLETLKQYDWVLMETYSFKDKTYRKTTSATAPHYRFVFNRFNKYGDKYTFLLKHVVRKSMEIIDRSEYKKAPFIKFKKQGGRHYIITRDNNTIHYSQIISFEKRMLIVDESNVSMAGTASSQRIRKAYLAMPKFKFTHLLRRMTGLRKNTQANTNTVKKSKKPKKRVVSTSSSNTRKKKIRYNNSGNCSVSSSTFNQVYGQIKGENFDKKKLNTANRLLRQHRCFTTAQVKKLVKLFPFSATRMKFLRSAYQYTVDKSNYYDIASELSFSKEKKELKKMMR